MKINKRVAGLAAAVMATAVAVPGIAGATQPSDELSPVRVTSIGFCNEVYLWWGQEHGIFADHGLDVELVPSQGGAAAVAAVMSEATDFAFTNGFTSLISLSQGFPLKFVSAAYESAPPGQPQVQGVWVSADSDIQSAEDLVDKRIGVNELGGINQIVTSQWLRAMGVDPKDVNFVALPLPQLAAAVADGQIDAAQVPIQNLGESADVLRSLGDPYQDGPGRVLFAGYVTTQKWFEENADLAEAFHASLAESMEQIQSEEFSEAAFELAAANCNQDPEVLASLPQNPYTADVDVELLGSMGEMLVEEGLLREAPDISEFVPEFAQK